MIPEPVTPAAQDFGRRAQSANDLELTLVGFLKKLFASARLDNPTLNLAQPEVVSFDPTQRAQTLELKVAPRIERGRIPRTVTGEIDVNKLPDCPSIIVQFISARVDRDETIGTARLLFTAYDENPDSGGYQDVLNMIEAAAIAFTQFGQLAIDKSYPIVMPIEWKLVESDTFPHFIGEMTTQWELPSAAIFERGLNFIPMEHIEVRASYDHEPQESLFESAKN